MKIKVPFKTWKVIIEKEVDFVFNIGTLEIATEDILGCDLFEVGEKNPYDVHVAILYAAYLRACEKQFKKPKYNMVHSIFWKNHMSEDSQAMFLKAVQDLLGKMSGKKEEKKK